MLGHWAFAFFNTDQKTSAVLKRQVFSYSLFASPEMSGAAHACISVTGISELTMKKSNLNVPVRFGTEITIQFTLYGMTAF